MTKRQKEITKIIQKLKQAWDLHPEYRLGQLVSNLQGSGVHNYRDIFFTSDEEWEQLLNKLINENGTV